MQLYCREGKTLNFKFVMLVLLTLFWTIAYIFAVIYAVRNKTHAIPPLSISLNFSWEIIAFFYYFEFIDIAWVIVDFFIVALIVDEFIEKQYKKGWLYIISFLCYGIVCAGLFNETFPDGTTGYIFLSFAMDLIMAIDFNLEFHEKQREKVVDGSLFWIAIFKFLGDAVALIIYRMYPSVLAFGVAVFFFNLIYIVRVYKELLKSPSQRKGAKYGGRHIRW